MAPFFRASTALMRPAIPATVMYRANPNKVSNGGSTTFRAAAIIRCRVMVPPSPARSLQPIKELPDVSSEPDDEPTWKPSIFMPRRVSRLTLEIESIRAERLSDISTDDAEAEGAIYWWNQTPMKRGNGRAILHPKEAFRTLWDSINESRGFGWESNPWVWVIQFKRV